MSSSTDRQWVLLALLAALATLLTSPPLLAGNCDVLKELLKLLEVEDFGLLLGLLPLLEASAGTLMASMWSARLAGNCRMCGDVSTLLLSSAGQAAKDGCIE